MLVENSSQNSIGCAVALRHGILSNHNRCQPLQQQQVMEDRLVSFRCVSRWRQIITFFRRQAQRNPVDIVAKSRAYPASYESTALPEKRASTTMLVDLAVARKDSSRGCHNDWCEVRVPARTSMQEHISCKTSARIGSISRGKQ